MTFTAAAETIDDLLRESLNHIVSRGDRVMTSRGETLEVRAAVLELRNPRARVSRTHTLPHMFSSLGETIWYLSGVPDHEPISHYVPKYMTHVGNGTGAYGPRLFGPDSQVERVINQLRAGPTTRQAVIQLFNVRDLTGHPKDVPCTCTLQFLQRDNRLDLVVYMRSNDLVMGFRHDVFAFTFLQELVARSIGCELGTYTHMVGSLHVYSRMRGTVDDYLAEGVQGPGPMPAMPAGDPWPDVNWLVRWELAVRSGSTLPPLAGLAPYWRELAQLVAAFRAYRARDEQAFDSIRNELSSSPYGIFVSDRGYLLEGPIEDA